MASCLIEKNKAMGAVVAMPSVALSYALCASWGDPLAGHPPDAIPVSGRV